MQEIRSSKPPVVTGICDPNKSRARHRRSILIHFYSKTSRITIIYRDRLIIFWHIFKRWLLFNVNWTEISFTETFIINIINSPIMTHPKWDTVWPKENKLYYLKHIAFRKAVLAVIKLRERKNAFVNNQYSLRFITGAILDIALASVLFFYKCHEYENWNLL